MACKLEAYQIQYQHLAHHVNHASSYIPIPFKYMLLLLRIQGFSPEEAKRVGVRTTNTFLWVTARGFSEDIRVSHELHTDAPASSKHNTVAHLARSVHYILGSAWIAMGVPMIQSLAQHTQCALMLVCDHHGVPDVAHPNTVAAHLMDPVVSGQVPCTGARDEQGGVVEGQEGVVEGQEGVEEEQVVEGEEVGVEEYLHHLIGPLAQGSCSIAVGLDVALDKGGEGDTLRISHPHLSLHQFLMMLAEKEKVQKAAAASSHSHSQSVINNSSSSSSSINVSSSWVPQEAKWLTFDNAGINGSVPAAPKPPLSSFHSARRLSTTVP